MLAGQLEHPQGPQKLGGGLPASGFSRVVVQKSAWRCDANLRGSLGFPSDVQLPKQYYNVVPPGHRVVNHFHTHKSQINLCQLATLAADVSNRPFPGHQKRHLSAPFPLRTPAVGKWQGSFQLLSFGQLQVVATTAASARNADHGASRTVRCRGMPRRSVYILYYIWLVVWNICYFSIYWE